VSQVSSTLSISTAVDLHEQLARSGLPEPFCLAAFSVLLKRELDETVAAMPSSTPPASSPVADPGIATDTSAAEALARRLGREVDGLQDIYDFSTEPIALIVSSGRLAPVVAHASMQIALLVVAARQAVANDDWTPASEIRAVCQDYARFDPSNFAGTLTSMHEQFAFRGKGAGREVRLTRPGWDAVSDLLDELGA
jgi:hypothetical protein